MARVMSFRLYWFVFVLVPGVYLSALCFLSQIKTTFRSLKYLLQMELAPVVQKADNFIHWISHNPVGKYTSLCALGKFSTQSHT